MVTACRSSCETTAQPKQSFPPTLAPSFLLSASLYLSVDILLFFFLALVKIIFLGYEHSEK